MPDKLLGRIFRAHDHLEQGIDVLHTPRNVARVTVGGQYKTSQFALHSCSGRHLRRKNGRSGYRCSVSRSNDEVQEGMLDPL